jgi:hypothetical protein
MPQLLGPHTRPTQSGWQTFGGGGGGGGGGGTTFFFFRFRRFFASVAIPPVSNPKALPMMPASAPRRDADDDSERTMASKTSASTARLLIGSENRRHLARKVNGSQERLGHLG